MAEQELIPNKEDREFTTSIGHWTGDGEWDPGPVGGKTGLQKVTLPADLSIKTIALGYPYVKPQPGEDNSLLFNMATKEIHVSGINYSFKLTDGNYTFEYADVGGFVGGIWASFGDVWTIPLDWDKTQSILTITLQQTEEWEADMVLDDFSLKAEVPGRADHLPLMGVH